MLFWFSGQPQVIKVLHTGSGKGTKFTPGKSVIRSSIFKSSTSSTPVRKIFVEEDNVVIVLLHLRRPILNIMFYTLQTVVLLPCHIQIIRTKHLTMMFFKKKKDSFKNVNEYIWYFNSVVHWLQFIEHIKSNLQIGPGSPTLLKAKYNSTPTQGNTIKVFNGSSGSVTQKTVQLTTSQLVSLFFYLHKCFIALCWKYNNVSAWNIELTIVYSS